MAATGLKTLGVAAGAAATGVAALGTAAVQSYADYEQLVGGVETLFGAGGQSASEYAISVGKSVLEINKEFNRLGAAEDLVMRNAENAFKTAGLSANEYMETVTSFSASLIASLEGDTLTAAEKSNVIITDMSDNANKMGSSMESIQNAYSGFAKQNYTMLDNLKLGYGGTKEEMQRLLDDAEAISGIEYDISSYADVADAIHVIQTEMGITGTTAKEASTTITGSLSAMKGAWSNLLVGVADGSQNIDTLIDDFVDSVETVAENILPVAEEALLGIGELVEQLFPVIIERIPDIINEVLPQLMESGLNIIMALITGIQENLPAIVTGALMIIQQLITAFLEMLPQIVQLGLDLIVQLALGIAEALPELVPAVVEVVLQIVNVLLNNISMLIDAAIVLIMALAEGLINALPILIEQIPTIVVSLVSALVENAPKLLEAALKLITTLAGALITYVPQLLAKIPEIITSLVNGFLDLCGNFNDVGQGIIDGIWSGISAGWDWLVGKVKELANNLFGAAKDELDINSPSRKFKWLAEMCVAGWDEGSEDLFNPNEMTRNINASLGTIRANVSGASNESTRAGLTQNITIYKEDSSPDELARAIRLESRYRLMGGYA